MQHKNAHMMAKLYCEKKVQNILVQQYIQYLSVNAELTISNYDKKQKQIRKHENIINF